MNKLCYKWEGENNTSFLQKNTFIKVMLSFFNLISPECKPFVCDVCGPYPKWLGFDGVSLAMSKDNVLWDTVETIHPRDGSTTTVGSTVLKQAERLLLPNYRTRKLLAQFCSGKPSLQKVEFKKLLKSLHKECKPLAALISNLQQEEERRNHPLPLFNFSFPGIWKEFLLLFSTNTSVAWIFKLAVIPTLLHLADTKFYTAESHLQLTTFCPPLATALVSIPNGSVPEELVELLHNTVRIVSKTFPSSTFAPAAPPTASNIPTSTIADKPSSQLKTNTSQQAWVDHLKSTVLQLRKVSMPLSTGFSYYQLDEAKRVSEPHNRLTGMKWSFPHIQVLPRFEKVDAPP